MANRHTLTRNRNLQNPDISAAFTEKQRRFLSVYSTRPWEVAEAARVAGCHRCTPYRWRAESVAFDRAMKATEDAEARRNHEEVLAWRRALWAKWRAEAKASTAEVLERLRRQLHRRR